LRTVDLGCTKMYCPGREICDPRSFSHEQLLRFARRTQVEWRKIDETRYEER
jgi:hypothetical protein